MANFLLLHGTDGSPRSNWFMWLKGVLIGQGHSVWLPQLPDAAQPNAESYTRFLLDNADFKYDGQTVVVGHSSGAVEVLHLLQHLPKGSTIRAAILVSAFEDNLGWDSLDGMFEEELDFGLIKSSCRRFVYIHSDDDPYCPLEHAQRLAAQTGGELVVMSGQGHFNTDHSTEYKQFPELLEIIGSAV